MLHSALPRAYLPPGYHLSSYFKDTALPYAYVQQQLDDSYARLSEQRVLTWDTTPRPTLPEDYHNQSRLSAAPCPLDLSLKPPPTPSTPPSARTDECEAIEVDDEEDRRSREEARSHHSSESRYPFGNRDPEEDVIVDDLDSQRSCSSAHSYQQQSNYERPKSIDIMGGLSQHDAERLRIAQEMSLSGYPEPLQNHQKLLLASPTHLHNYHQQLLLTPTHHHHLQGIHAPMTPPSTPSPPQCFKRKNRDENASSPNSMVTPTSTTSTTPTTPKQSSDKPRIKKKHARKLKFDEDTSSPVSGTVILRPDEAIVQGDIDPAFNIVEVTEEARAELAKIENRLGPYQCKLCRQLHDDAFQLAQHRCSRIAHVEYRCPECDKRFSCPANLASHRRWHKPRPNATQQSADDAINANNTEFSCTRCDAKFTRQAALRKHMFTQHSHEQNNNNNNHGGDQNGCKEIGETTVSTEID